MKASPCTIRILETIQRLVREGAQLHPIRQVVARELGTTPGTVSVTLRRFFRSNGITSFGEDYFLRNILCYDFSRWKPVFPGQRGDIGGIRQLPNGRFEVRVSLGHKWYSLTTVDDLPIAIEIRRQALAHIGVNKGWTPETATIAMQRAERFNLVPARRSVGESPLP